MSTAPQLFTRKSKIIRGRTEKGYPSVCRVELTAYDGSTYTCTGTLIAPDLVLCAAHCVTYPKKHAAVCIFEGGERVSARRWYWSRQFKQDDIERNITEKKRLKAVENDFTILELNRPIRNVAPSPLMPLATFKKLVREKRIRAITAVGFGRFSKYELEDLYDQIIKNEKRSASFTKFTFPPQTETMKVYPTEKVKGEPVSVSVGDSGGPYFARYRGVNYVVGMVSTVTHDVAKDVKFATALSVDPIIEFFRDSLFLDYRQQEGPLGYKYISPDELKAMDRHASDLVTGENKCIHEYCIEEKPILFGALAVAPILIYTYLAIRIKGMT